jgi:CBS domain-containing protein
MSTRGLTGVKRLMFGSTAEEVVRLADVPVFLVNPECPEPARAEPAPRDASTEPNEDAPAAAAAPRSLLMRVSDLMHRNPQTATPGMSLQRAGRLMAEADCGVLPVVGSAGDVVGMLTDRDVCLALSLRDRQPSAVQVRHVITGDVWSCGADDELSSALRTMAAQRVRRLPVVDGAGRLIGILSLDDVIAETRELDATGRPTYAEIAETLKAICTHQVPALR